MVRDPACPEGALLAGVRVLDLTDERGLYAGRIFADLGAEVIMVEPPGGSPARVAAPLLDPAAPERGSALWNSFCRNKKSIVLDLDEDADRGRFLRLVKSADILFESLDAGRMESLGLGSADLAEVNPALVYTSISAFGRRGPKAGYQSTDLILWAASGALYPAGGGYSPSRDGDRPPVRVSVVPQAYLHAGADAAAGALIAYLARRPGAAGQHVEVTAQQSLSLAAMGCTLAALVGHPEPAPERVAGPPRSDLFKWETRDGMVTVWLSRAAGLWQLMRESGAVADNEGDVDLAVVGQRHIDGTLTDTDRDTLSRLAKFVKTRSNDELLAAATERGLVLGSILDMAQVAASPHLADRDFWAVDARGRRHPRGPVVLDGRRVAPATGTAPTVGQHDAEVLGRDRVADRTQRQRPASTASSAAAGLADLKVLDLAWVIAGPTISRSLADYGAVVVKVEPTPGRGQDTARYMIPFHGGVPEPGYSAGFDSTNAGKLGIALDLRDEADRTTVHELVRWADVIIESFAPGTLDRLGFGYPALAALNPDVILVSTSVMGQSGRYSKLKGTGQIAGALGGIEHLVGWPDRPPLGLPNAYTDIVAPRVALPALLAALDRRRRTGAGCHLDISQMEAGLEFVSPALELYLATGTVAGRAGNDDQLMAPHGVYPARPTGNQHDAWVAIAARDDRDFRALAEALGRADLATEARFADPETRQRHAPELDRAVADWTRARTARETETVLQAVGVPAHAVLDSAGVASDGQLRFRGHFVGIPHPLHGTTYVEASRYQLNRTPARVDRPGPMFDQHRELILNELLGHRLAET